MEAEVKNICKKVKEAANNFAGVNELTKNAVLLTVKELLLTNVDKIIDANKVDIVLALKQGRNQAFIDRLTLTPERIKLMADGLDAIVALGDPVGEVTEEYVLPNGLKVYKIRAPLGVVGIIFEARPNVAVDAAALCIKSGNGVVLRGSSDSSESVNALVGYIKEGLSKHGLSPNLVGNIEPKDRSTSVEMLKQEHSIDVVIPRGGESLKKVVLENATMPVIASSGGNCHIYVASSADIDVANEIILNAKTSRPAVCNALETLLIDIKIAEKALPMLCANLANRGVEIRLTKEAAKYYKGDKIVDMNEMYIEYDDLIVKVNVVQDINDAIAHINEYGTHHSEAIISTNELEIEKFMKEVDSCALYANASTRFTDGFELGLGAEMGISTQKLHVRGPIGLKELTSVKYCVYGEGHIRK